MVNGFKGKVIKITNDYLYLLNDTGCLEIYNDGKNNLELDKEYFLFVYQHKVLMAKGIERQEGFGFLKLEDLILFKELILLDGIGIKTAYKFLDYGIDELHDFVVNHEIPEIMEHYKVSEKIATVLMNHYLKTFTNKSKNFDIKKINDAIYYLQQLGYSKELSTKIVWKRKKEVAENNFNQVFPTLISDIKNERAKY